MKKLFLLVSVVISFNFLSAQVPKDGFYTYKIVYVESNGKISEMCKVLIKDNNIRVIRNAGKNDLDEKYELVVEGIIIKHKKSGKWIIGINKKDADAIEFGGCSDGPIEIDFKNKIVYMC